MGLGHLAVAATLVGWWDFTEGGCMLVRRGWFVYLRLIDSCITQLKAQGPSRTCNESKEEGLVREGTYATSKAFLGRGRWG